MINMNEQNELVSEKFRIMGTEVSVDLVVSDDFPREDALRLIKGVRNVFLNNEKIFSRFDAESELTKINRNLNIEQIVSDEMFEVLQLCLKFNDISRGYFDPRVIEILENIGYDKDFMSNNPNSFEGREINLEFIDSDIKQDISLNEAKKAVFLQKRIDTTGIAKGWAVDQAVRYLRNEGWVNFIVDAGGDMFACGVDEYGEKWKIGIEGLNDDKVALKLQDEGIATSGISRKHWQIGEKKFHHLINPKDPKTFSYDIKTVTVISEKTVEADGRAKTLVLMGKERGLQFANENNIKALFLDYRGNVYISEKIKEHLI